MIAIAVAVAQALLIACILAAVVLAYWYGLRRGIEIIARVELREANPDAPTVPDVWRDYVKEVRIDVQNYDNEAAYQLWRRANKLPEGDVTRELFRDKSYREALRSQYN